MAALNQAIATMAPTLLTPNGLVLVPEEHPVLHARTHPVQVWGADLVPWIRAMLEIMDHHGGIGLAAPQVGLPWSLAIIRLPDDDEAKVLINPTLTMEGQPSICTEGCLSLPGVLGWARRWPRVRVSAWTTPRTPWPTIASGLLAQCLQHEVDHLEGRLIAQPAG